uniref:Zinc transporter ZIP6 n=1 Tax=Pundamilia nyererei TaxID=303518 RepID=A0A3B4GG09_9CICH
MSTVCFCPQEEEEMSAVLVLMFLFAVSSDSLGAVTDCSGSTMETNSRAEQSRREHLEALFNRYGENGTISLAGLKRLLQSVGLGRMRTVMVQHHEQPGHHHHHHHHQHKGHHHHHHPHENGSQGRPSGEQTTRIAITESQTQATASSDSEHDRDQDRPHGRSQNGSECLNASFILSSHGMSQEAGVTLRDFSFLCPALLNQIDGGACVLHGDASAHGHKHHKHAHGHHGDHNHSDHDHSEHMGGENSRNITTAWVGGFLSITIISLLSLLGVVLIPLMNKVFFKFLLSFLVALAVGTLSGDAFLHLIPHVTMTGHHHHDDDAAMTGHEHEENLDAVWKGLTALSGVYFMFLIEHFLTLGKMYKDKKQKIQKKCDQNENADPEKQPALEENSVSVVSPQDCENKCHSHFHDTVGQTDSRHHHHHDYHHILHHHHSQNHHPHSHSHSYSEQHFQEAGVATLAWMVIMGDGLHNFSDGLAIGAAFTEGLSSGLSTSVAVFCHELPHELGDFAVLLKAGMTVRQAILYNVLSAMMAYLGMITGILIGHYAENISTWIFALTAGLFMYVALVDMVPEMLHNDAGDHGFSHWGFFLLQNAGILLGFCIMLLIAIFEHKIQLDLGY